MELARWSFDHRARKYCWECREAGKAQCKGCDYAAPALLPGNVDISWLLEMCATHWRVGATGGLLGLDWGTILDVADRLGIATDAGNLEKLRLWEATALSMREGAKDE